jgi:tetratricopeptide (TPR) repeat protein
LRGIFWTICYKKYLDNLSLEIKREEMADELLKRQNQLLAQQNVEKGVDYFKQDRISDAMACFKKALSIDDQNVDAFVARGALYTNEGELDKAIDDFQSALALNSQHSNAKKYLMEVFLTYSIKYIFAVRLFIPLLASLQS